VGRFPFPPRKVVLESDLNEAGRGVNLLIHQIGRLGGAWAAGPQSCRSRVPKTLLRDSMPRSIEGDPTDLMSERITAGPRPPRSKMDLTAPLEPWDLAPVSNVCFPQRTPQGGGE